MGNNNVLLSKNIVKKYDINKTKECIKEILEELEEAKFVAKILIEPTITPTNNISFSSNKSYTYDKVGNFIEKKLDTLKFIEETNKTLDYVCKTFSLREQKYFLNYFIYKKSEEKICELMHFSRTSLVPMKESCIVKM